MALTTISPGLTINVGPPQVSGSSIVPGLSGNPDSALDENSVVTHKKSSTLIIVKQCHVHARHHRGAPKLLQMVATRLRISGAETDTVARSGLR